MTSKLSVFEKLTYYLRELDDSTKSISAIDESDESTATRSKFLIASFNSAGKEAKWHIEVKDLDDVMTVISIMEKHIETTFFLMLIKELNQISLAISKNQDGSYLIYYKVSIGFIDFVWQIWKGTLLEFTHTIIAGALKIDLFKEDGTSYGYMNDEQLNEVIEYIRLYIPK